MTEFKFNKKIVFKEWLYNYEDDTITDDIINARNCSIYLTIFEFITNIIAFYFYNILIVNFLFTIIGFFSKLKLNLCGLLVHCLYLTSFIGGLLIFTLLDYFIKIQ